jgi:Pectate lyase superfamily protein
MALSWQRLPGRAAATRRRVLLSIGMACPIWQAWPAQAWASSVAAAATSHELNVIASGADPTGQSDSSAAFRRAIAASNAVFIPAGRFVIGDVALRSGLSLRGQGHGSELVQRSGSQYGLWCDSGSPAVADNLLDIRIRSLRLRGQADVDGFSEHQHLLNLNGVTRCVVEGVSFVAFRGDAIYLGSSNLGATERHNRDVKIRDCSFDGVNYQNRNAISVIDCDGLLIDSCRFERVARPDMPGAIDLEPNLEPFHVVRNVRITNNRFSDIGGGVGVVSLVVPARMATPSQAIVVSHNEIHGARCAAFCLLQRGVVDKASRPRGLEISRNTVLAGADRPFHIEGVNRTMIEGNRFVACHRSALVGYLPPALSVTELTMIGNRFEQCGWQDTAGLRVHDLLGGRLERNEWIDCGNGGPGAAAIELGSGQSASLDFHANTFSTPLGLTRYAIRRARAHTSVGAPGRFRGNRVGAGMLNQFNEANTS